jgi:predicted neuraminidase
VLSTSGDGGITWEEVMVVDPDGGGPLRAFDPQVWIAPDHSLWLFYAVGGRRNTDDPVDTWFVKTDDPDNKNAVWSDQRFLATGVMMDKPTTLASGDWLFPVALWGDKNKKSDPAHDNSAKVYGSRDKGATFSLLGACNLPVEARVFDEHILVERKNGSLWMLVRTTYGIGESVSTDRGKTWSELQPSKIMHTSSRFFITRLSSGNLLLVKNGPVDVKTNRSHMMTFISKDDGLTWSRGLLLDERLGTSYPDGQQTKDGRIHIIYDFSRTNEQLILKTDFTEADILDPHYDAAMVRVFNNRKTVSKGGK